MVSLELMDVAVWWALDLGSILTTMPSSLSSSSLSISCKLLLLLSSPVPFSVLFLSPGLLFVFLSPEWFES